MARSGFGLDTVLRVATSPLPRPVQYALGSKFRFYFSMICIGCAMFFGVIHLGWNNGRPSVTVDRQQLQNLEQKGLNMVQSLQQGLPANQQVNLQPLLPSNYINANGQYMAGTQYQQPTNNGYRAPTAYNMTTPYTASQPMVYPQQPNYQQPLTGMPQQYQPTPYTNSGYGQQPYANSYANQQRTNSQYSSQSQYSTPGYSNPYAAQPSAYPQSSQYGTTAYPTNAQYPTNGQPARSYGPQYSAPGYR